ncbi:MAG TPA: hypothetical protein VFV98_02620 [Vicinamibacterales bacterium]|nr:hypothetical protein [Vicinamibacterales bacterium]
MTPNVSARSRHAAFFTLAALFAVAAPALAQVDPLIALKRLPPNVIVVVDTSFRMLDDGNGNVYDVKTYTKTDDNTVASALGVSAAQYRRIYQNLLFETTQTASSKYTATDIIAVPSTASNYSTFWSPTRFETAKTGIAQAVTENQSFVRWGLMKLRQAGEVWRNTSASNDCDRPVRVLSNATLSSSLGDRSPCDSGGLGGLGLGGDSAFVIYAPNTGGPNYSVTTAASDALVYGVGTSSATANILTALQQTMGTGPLIPASKDGPTYVDRPIDLALADALTHAKSVMAADTNCRACRNTVIVLVTAGKDDGDSAYADTHDPITTAASFAAVTQSGATRRIPIVVVGIKPAAADETELNAIATASGGRYFKALTASDVTFAVNYAVQLGYAKAVDVDAIQSSDFTFLSPIVGTVNLEGAPNATGSTLPDSAIVSTSGPTSGQAIPQRSNFMLTAGFGLPGFDGRLRAFRTFKPVADATKPTGWKFVKDGSRLWPDLDSRPALAGMARTPASPDSRNIYTYIPSGSSGGTMVAFTVANQSTLAPYLSGADATTLINYVRSLPLGAIIGSTPAIMDPPSLDPPPDSDYGFKDSVGTFAGNHKDRRSMIFFGANDGMIHCVDARTGYEVWAFIPFNLLPKLKTLLDGQSVERFDYFVDSSPKLAEVKLGGTWKTIMVIGQSYGGTFYQAFDITEAGMGVAPDADGIGAVNNLLAKFDNPGESITFNWAFPRYNVFDTTVSYTATLTDGFPGGQVRIYGDLMSTANDVEKRVGFTFSDPAVGPLITDRSVTAVISGSGYFPAIEDALPGRGTSAPRAGRSLFVIDANTGLPVGNAGGGACSGTGCYDTGDVSNGRKNAVQADVTAAGDLGGNVVTRAYVGDIDGRYWRFTLTSAGAITALQLVDTAQPIYSSSALLQIGTTDRYLFFGTGSDLLAASTPGGGSTGAGTAFKFYSVKDNASSGSVSFTRDLSPKVISTALLTNGERPTSSPTVAGDIVFFTTTVDGTAESCSDALTRLYAFTYLGTAAYDTSGNGHIDTGESPIVATTAGRGSAPFIVDQHLFMGTTSATGAGVTVFGDAEDFNNGVGQVGVRILSWREIR